MCDFSLTELHFFYFFLQKPAWMQNTAGFNSSRSLQPAGPEKKKAAVQHIIVLCFLLGLAMRAIYSIC